MSLITILISVSTISFIVFYQIRHAKTVQAQDGVQMNKILS